MKRTGLQMLVGARCCGLLAALLLAGAGLLGAAEPAAKKMNVLFVAVDDLRPEFGAYGASYVRSPNLDRLAQRGVTFERAYCQQAVCSPSRSSLLTGMRPDATKVWDLETHFRVALPQAVTLPQCFKQHGYFVQGMGKLYHGGFDDGPSWSTPWTSPKLPHGAYALPENQALVQAKLKANQAKIAEAKAKKAAGQKAAKVRSYGPPTEAAETADETYHDGALAEMARAALRECAQRKQPFWLGVGFIRPHLPFVAPKKYWDLYNPAEIQLAPNPFPPRGAPDYAVLTGGELRSYHGVPAGPIPDDQARHLRHGYYAALSYMDAQLGKLLDELDRLGLAENTIVVLWGDHGWKLGEHAGWCKHSNVENDTRAPLLIAVPGLASAGRKTAALAEFVDIYPTLAELCGLTAPSELQGTSLVPVLRDPTRTVKTAAFSQYPRAVSGKQLMGYSMRTERYRFTRWVGRKDPSQVDAVELYDHQTDPQENQNLARDPKYGELVDQLTAAWKKGWQGAKLGP